MRTDVFHPRKIPFVYVSPPVCDFIFSASGIAEIFLNTRSPAGPITGFTITLVDGVYQLRWDAYPGALCYSVYKLVDELDPFSGYTLVAECITDNFLDTTDPGAYVVTPVTPKGEPDFPDPTPTPQPPPPGCVSTPPSLIGTEEYVCPGQSVQVDLAGLVSGGTPPFTYAANTGTGSASVAGSTLTYTAPAGLSSPVTVNIIVTDACGETYLTAVSIIPIEEGVLTVPTEPLRVCTDEPLVVDMADYVDFGDADTSLQVQSANIFDQGGSVVFGEGSAVTYTPSSASLGEGTLRITATDECGNEYTGDFPILVVCQCTDAMADVSTGPIIGGASGSWSGSFGSASISAVVAPFSGTVPSTTWEELAVTNCIARIVLSGTLAVFALVNVNGSNIFSSSTPGTYLVPFSTKIGTNSASIIVGNSPGGSCTCLVELGPV